VAHTLASGYLRNDNGKYSEFIEFEDAMQLAPITTFAEIKSDNITKLIVGGNSDKVNTYHGSYTSLKGLLVEDQSNYRPVSKLGMSPFNDQIKQIEVVKMRDNNVIFVLSNSAELKQYTYSE
jgi:hypothetical protein